MRTFDSIYSLRISSSVRKAIVSTRLQTSSKASRPVPYAMSTGVADRSIRQGYDVMKT